MIFESKYWKGDILKAAKRLKNSSTQLDWSEKNFVRIEKDIFVSFYAIRKLIDCQKISDEISISLVSVISYKSLGKPTTRMNWYEFEELYDLKNGKKEKINLRTLCNQIIHSYIFFPSFNRKKIFNGIYITSDNNRNRKLFKVRIAEIISIFEKVGNNYPRVVSFIYDDKKKDYKVKSFGNMREVKKVCPIRKARNVRRAYLFAD